MKMKRILSFMLAVCMIVSCAALFSACGEKKSDNFPVTVGGAQINAEPKRVVVLNDAFADVILYMGYDLKLVGRSIECTQRMMNVLPSVGPAASPDISSLMGLQPDLVIADNTLGAQSRSELEGQGVTVIVLNPVATKEDIRQLYIDLGTALGGKTDGSKKGEDSCDKLFKLLDEYNNTTKGIVVTDAYLYLDESDNYCTFTRGSIESMLFSYNGAKNVFADKLSPAFIASEITESVSPDDELAIRYASPTYLFLDGTVAPDGTIQSPVYEKLIADPNLAHLSALREGRVTFIPRENFFRPGVSFEETLFTMIDALNKDGEAAEQASLNATTPQTTMPPTDATVASEAPSQAASTAETTATEASGDGEEGDYAEDGEYYDENAQ